MSRPRIIPDGMAEWYGIIISDGEATATDTCDELASMPLQDYSRLRARFLRRRTVIEPEPLVPHPGEAIDATVSPDTVAVPAALWVRVKEVLNGAARNEAPTSLGLRARPVMKEISRI